MPYVSEDLPCLSPCYLLQIWSFGFPKPSKSLYIISFTTSIFLRPVLNVFIQYLRIGGATYLKAFKFPSRTALSHSDGLTAPEIMPRHHRKKVSVKHTITLLNWGADCITEHKEKLKRGDPPLQTCSLASGFAGRCCSKRLRKNGKNKSYYLGMIAVASFKMQLAESVHKPESVCIGSGSLMGGQRNHV